MTTGLPPPAPSGMPPPRAQLPSHEIAAVTPSDQYAVQPTTSESAWVGEHDPEAAYRGNLAAALFPAALIAFLIVAFVLIAWTVVAAAA